MLFYNIQIHSYVVVELKTTSFKAEYIGQLSAYVGAVNHSLKGKEDGQTIGLLICKDKNGNSLYKEVLEKAKEVYKNELCDI